MSVSTKKVCCADLGIVHFVISYALGIFSTELLKIEPLPCIIGQKN